MLSGTSVHSLAEGRTLLMASYVAAMLAGVRTIGGGTLHGTDRTNGAMRRTIHDRHADGPGPDPQVRVVWPIFFTAP